MYQERKQNLNAYKHGLTAQTLILEPEDKPVYDAHCKSYFDLYKPVGRPEELLVHMIADDYWRALRGRAIETALMSKVFERGGLELDEREQKTLANVGLYLQRIERSIRNNTKALKEMQSDRKVAQISDRKGGELVFSQPVAAAPVEQASASGTPWVPGFSPGEQTMKAA